MNKLTYNRLMNRTLELYLDEKYEQAYKFITENAGEVKGNAAQIYNFRYTTANKAGKGKLALSIMEEAILEKELWYSYEYLMSDDDLASLRPLPAFQKMADLCKERETATKLTAAPDMKVIKGIPGTDLLIALHGNEENISLAEPFWLPALEAGYSLVLPQSSNVQFSEGYMWEDPVQGANEIKELLSHLRNGLGQVVLGGFSAGAGTTLYSLLAGGITAAGFILVAPWLPDIGEWEPLLDKLREEDIKGIIIYGEQDEDCKEGAKAFENMLFEKGIRHQSIVYPELDHDFPDDFAEFLPQALSFIKG